MPANQYDVVIIGAGAGGGTVAERLARAGKRVLVLERGKSQSYANTSRDHLRNMRLSQHGNNAGPDGRDHIRVMGNADGTETPALPHQGGYHNNAATVGGGTLVYGAQAWRFHPHDFAMKTRYGVPAGSSLEDWPLTYGDLAPYYEAVEHELGVAGDATALYSHPPFRVPYPMPPHAPALQSRVMKAGADALGWRSHAAPLAINTRPYNGRAACVRCAHCVGFACPTDAKSGTQNTFLPRAVLTGRCDIIAESMVTSLRHDGKTVSAVTFFGSDNISRTVTADVFVLAAGAIESARTLLVARIGNSAHVGRNLQGHYYPGATGLFPRDIKDCEGPGVGVSVTEFVHGNEGIVGGGMLADEFTLLPIIAWKRKLPPDLPRWGANAHTFLKRNYLRIADITGPVQEIPIADSRVALHPHLRDKWGTPVAFFSGTAHNETVRTARFMNERAKEWLIAAGACRVWGDAPGASLSGGQHQAGTCRMGHDPDNSVVDGNCRVHDMTNLYVADASVHVTNGTFNPFLTVMALAARTGEHIARVW